MSDDLKFVSGTGLFHWASDPSEPDNFGNIFPDAGGSLPSDTAVVFFPNAIFNGVKAKHDGVDLSDLHEGTPVSFEAHKSPGGYTAHEIANSPSEP